MNSYINFSLNLDNKQQDNVFLYLEGQSQIEMNVFTESKPGNFIYEAKIQIPPPFVFPKCMMYNYVVNGTNLYKLNQSLVISKQPLSSTIYVNDEKAPKLGKNDINITFYIFMNSNISNNSLFLISDSPVFGEQSQSYFPLQQVRNSNIWAATAQISNFLNQPIIYKYVICDSNGRELSKESGKPHVLFIHSPVAHKNVVIYDVWLNYIPFLSLYPHLIKPSEASLLQSLVKIDFIPSYKCRKVYIRGKLIQDEEMLTDGVTWCRDLQLPSTFENFTFELGMVTPQSENINWISDPIYKIHHPYPNNKQDLYVSNLFYGDPFHDKMIGIYIPLVSIVSDKTKSVGDFASLVSLSKWCKQCRIDIINIHIELIKGGLIDPIHSNILIENEHQIFEQSHPSCKMSAIRNEKLNALWIKFNSWQKDEDEEFKIFTICNPKIIKNCDNEFSIYVQYTLFKEFSFAFAEIVDMGIQLILDLDMSFDLKDQLITYSHYAQGIRIVGLSHYIDRLTIGDIKQLFNSANDDRMFKLFMQNFCKEDPYPILKPNSSDDKPVVLLKTCYSQPFIQSLESSCNLSGIDPEFPAKLEKLKMKYQKSEKSKILINNLSKIIPDCASSIFLDNEATKKLGYQNVSSMNLIPCSQANTNLLPNFLSPEKISEFGADANLSDEIKRRIKSNAKTIIIYFLDFLKAMSEGENDLNIQIKPIQLIQNYCRCAFEISISDLMQNQELNQRIQKVLYSAKQCK